MSDPIAARVALRVLASDKPGPGLRPYVAFYKGKRLELYAKTTFDAQKEAAEKFKAKRRSDVHVMLADVVHTPVD